MTPFEYLSVLVSIIIGLALTRLLSGAARLIQLRRRVRPDAITLGWMAFLFLINIQIWWVAFERREESQWNFFSFVLYLLIPICAFLLSYLVLPELGDEDVVDLPANFDAGRPWFFGLLALLPTISLIEEAIRDGGLPLDPDVLSRLVLAPVALLAATIRSRRFHFWNMLFALFFICSYVVVLFLKLD